MAKNYAREKEDKNYMVRVGITSAIEAEALQDAIEQALFRAGILNTVYEIYDDDGGWELTHRDA